MPNITPQTQEPHGVSAVLIIRGLLETSEQVLQNSARYTVKYKPRLGQQQFLQDGRTLECSVLQGACRYSVSSSRPVLRTWAGGDSTGQFCKALKQRLFQNSELFGEEQPLPGVWCNSRILQWGMLHFRDLHL